MRGVTFLGERKLQLAELPDPTPGPNEVVIDVSRDLLRKQLTVIGSWTFSTIGQADCARFVADREIDVDRLFTHHWRLDQAIDAYRVFDQQTSGKGVFVTP